ncbi:Heat shock protein beta-1 [Trichuris trichiura]|uniref:Heat shock protein beta-1 n=1 Tax=Trichuris trichiura TaxID=36087 RepID=A0A077Z0R6_TRITR|nr:Heat shock protein beta-1 [Trichuris trichiura]
MEKSAPSEQKGDGSKKAAGFDELWQKYVQAEKRKDNQSKQQLERLRLKQFRWMQKKRAESQRGTEGEQMQISAKDLQKKDLVCNGFCYEVEERSTMKVWRVQIKLHHFELKDINVTTDGKKAVVTAEKKNKDGKVVRSYSWNFKPYAWASIENLAVAWNAKKHLLIIEAPKTNAVSLQTCSRHM